MNLQIKTRNKNSFQTFANAILVFQFIASRHHAVSYIVSIFKMQNEIYCLLENISSKDDSRRKKVF